MSRSYRKYKGLSHTCSDMRFQKSVKVKRRRGLRAKAKVSEDGVELFKKGCSHLWWELHFITARVILPGTNTSWD